MFDKGITPVHIFGTSNRFIEAYHTVLQPMCKATGLPPLAVDILMFAANNPEHATARNVCKYRGLKPGIVSVHVERLVSEGLLERREVPGDRRQTLLVCTAKTAPIVEEGHRLQKIFAEKLVAGLSEADKEAFKKTMALLSHNLDEIRKNGIK